MHHDDKALKMYKGTKHSKESRACFCCNRTGHLKKDCSIWKAKQRKLELSTKERVKATTKDTADTSWSGTFKVTQSSKPCSWCINSGATSHMTSNETFFINIDYSAKDSFPRKGKSITSDGKGQGFLNCITPPRRRSPQYPCKDSAVCSRTRRPTSISEKSCKQWSHS